MENLTEEELFELASSKISNMETNLSVNKLLMVILIVEAFLYFTNVISPNSYLLFVLPCWGLYIFHYFKYRKSLKIVENILDEFNKREKL